MTVSGVVLAYFTGVVASAAGPRPAVLAQPLDRDFREMLKAELKAELKSELLQDLGELRQMWHPDDNDACAAALAVACPRPEHTARASVMKCDVCAGHHQVHN
jgi:hypothetical protein